MAYIRYHYLDAQTHDELYKLQSVTDGELLDMFRKKGYIRYGSIHVCDIDTKGDTLLVMCVMTEFLSGKLSDEYFFQALLFKIVETAYVSGLDNVFLSRAENWFTDTRTLEQWQRYGLEMVEESDGIKIVVPKNTLY